MGRTIHTQMYPMSKWEGDSLQNRIPLWKFREGGGISNGTQVSTKWNTGHDETDNTLSPEPDTGLSQNGETDSYTTVNITDGESYHIHQADNETEKTIDAMEDVNAYIEIIKENIEYDHYMKYGDWQARELFDELFEIICEVVCVKHKTVRIGGDEAKEMAMQMMPDIPDTMFVLTNDTKVNGAAAILNDDIRQEIAEKVGDFYMLPSSIHETLIIPKEAGMEFKELEQMVQEVNQTQVAPGERLSDHVYEYDVKEHELFRSD